MQGFDSGPPDGDYARYIERLVSRGPTSPTPDEPRFQRAPHGTASTARAPVPGVSIDPARAIATLRRAGISLLLFVLGVALLFIAVTSTAVVGFVSFFSLAGIALIVWAVLRLRSLLPRV